MCDPPPPEPKKSNHQERRHRRDKPRSIKQTPLLEEEDEPTATSSFVECDMVEVPHLFVLRTNDGLKLQVGNIVKVENFVGPLMIVDLSQKHNELLAKLCPFNVVSNAISIDFEIQCDVKYISSWDGEKLKSKTVSDKAYNIASLKYFSYLACNDCPALRICYRRVILGKVLRNNIQSGFSNLNSTRFSLGPFDAFCDGQIFGFGLSTSRKFSILEDGDFPILDSVMGGRWDVKLGKDADSFFKFVTVVEVSRNTDFALHVNVRFSESKFLFCNEYRQTCKGVILEKKHEIANGQELIL